VVKIFLTIAFICLSIKFNYAQDGQSFCKSFIQCTQNADDLRAECEKLIRISFPTKNAPAKSVKSTKSAPVGDCGSNVKNISQQLVQKQNEQRQLQRDCLNKHMSDATVVTDKSRLAICQKAIDASNSTHRLKRKVCTGKGCLAKDVSSNATVSANITTTVPVNGTVHEESKNATAGTDYAAYGKCIQESEAKAKACRPLGACCSEVTTCDFDYQLSPLHDEIAQLQYDLFKQYRLCQKEKTKTVDTGKPK